LTLKLLVLGIEVWVVRQRRVMYGRMERQVWPVVPMCVVVIIVVTVRRSRMLLL
jgi:hypothetical protein